MAAQTPRPPTAPDTTPILSTLGNDPDMRELVALFVDEIPQRVTALQDLWTRRDLDQLRRVAHQLKGACGGYGFSNVGSVAAKLERTLTSDPANRSDEQLTTISRQVDDLVAMCRRMQTA